MNQNPYNEVVMSPAGSGMSVFQHNFIWGSNREGMSQMGLFAEVALLETGLVTLISQGAIERNDLPLGFVRFLSEEEKRERGILRVIDRGESYANLLRMGRKHSPDNSSKALKSTPYYRQFDKRKF